MRTEIVQYVVIRTVWADPQPNDNRLFVHRSHGPVAVAYLHTPNNIELVFEVEFKVSGIFF